MFCARLCTFFPASFYFFENEWKFQKNDQLLMRKIKPLHKYFLAAVGKAFSTKFEYDAKMPNSAFGNV